MDTVCTGHTHHTNTLLKIWLMLRSAGLSVDDSLVGTCMNEGSCGEGIGDGRHFPRVPSSVVLDGFKDPLKLFLLRKKVRTV